MSSEARRRIVKALCDMADSDVDPGLCATCARLLKVSGAAIAVVTQRGHRGVLCSSNHAAAFLEDLQVTLGEGPGVDAHRLGISVDAPDLGDSGHPEWLAFCALAQQVGTEAVFAFPLHVGLVQLGTLTFNNDRAGRLSDDQYADALVLVDVVTHAVLAIQAKAPPGTVAPALEAMADDGAEMHQAAGMLAIRLDVTVPEALVCLRALAYAEERPVATVAHDVVSRTLDIE